jgi:hypothetical protein
MTSTKKEDLTATAVQGFQAEEGAKCPHYDSSPNGMAWLVGQWLKKTGRAAPRDVRMSRGYTVHANDMLVSVKNPRAIERLQ